MKEYWQISLVFYKMNLALAGKSSGLILSINLYEFLIENSKDNKLHGQLYTVLIPYLIKLHKPGYPIRTVIFYLKPPAVKVSKRLINIMKEAYSEIDCK